MVSRADDLRLRDLLVERLGEEATDRLLERLPLTPVENFATRDDITGVRAEILALRGEMLDEFGKLRGEFGELRGELGTLRGEFGELRGEFGALRAEIADRMRVQTLAVAGLVATSMGVAVAIAGLA